MSKYDIESLVLKSGLGLRIIVQQFKYLGHVISNEERDDDDIARSEGYVYTC